LQDWDLMFDRSEELEWKDFEVKEANISISKSSFDTVSAFSNINSWKDYYKDELLRSDGVDFHKITFPFANVVESSEKAGEKTREKFRDKLGEKDTIKDTEKVGEEVLRTGGQKGWSELTEKQTMILQLIKPSVSRKELSIELKINESAIQKHLENIKKKGLLRRIGADRGRRWEVVGR
jgi:DNA-binding CsgD family transcriptional regulator